MALWAAEGLCKEVQGWERAAVAGRGHCEKTARNHCAGLGALYYRGL